MTLTTNCLQHWAVLLLPIASRMSWGSLSTPVTCNTLLLRAEIGSSARSRPQGLVMGSQTGQRPSRKGACRGPILPTQQATISFSRFSSSRQVRQIPESPFVHKVCTEYGVNVCMGLHDFEIGFCLRDKLSVLSGHGEGQLNHAFYISDAAKSDNGFNGHRRGVYQVCQAPFLHHVPADHVTVRTGVQFGSKPLRGAIWTFGKAVNGVASGYLACPRRSRDDRRLQIALSCLFDARVVPGPGRNKAKAGSELLVLDMGAYASCKVREAR